MRWLYRCAAFFAANRLKEALILQGAPLLGAVFALDRIDGSRAVGISLLALGSFLLVAAVFLFNDWGDLRADLLSGCDSDRLFTERGITSAQMLWFCLVLGVSSLVILCALSARTGALGGLCLLAGFLYSHPRTYAKGVPVLSSLIHFAAQAIQFQMGYTLFRDFDRRGLLLSIFFSLVFVAGHLSQEVRDFEGDNAARTRTNAVFFGPRRAFFAGHAAFTAAFAYLAWLAWTQVVSKPILYLVPLYLPYAALFWWTVAGGISLRGVTRYRTGYRAIFLLLGIGIAALSLAPFFFRSV